MIEVSGRKHLLPIGSVWRPWQSDPAMPGIDCTILAVSGQAGKGSWPVIRYRQAHRYRSHCTPLERWMRDMVRVDG